MLLPLPIIIGWIMAISSSDKLSEDSLQRVYYFAPWIGLSFMVLALTIAVFVRLRQRWLRVSLLAASGLLTLSLVVYFSTGRLNNLAFLGPVLVMWGVLLVPPLLERRLKNVGGKIPETQKNT
jgi:cell division protein FtsW (lipid II flippase)